MVPASQKTSRRTSRVQLAVMLLTVALVAFGLCSILQLFGKDTARAQQAPIFFQGGGSGTNDDCIAAIPDVAPVAPSHRVVQLVNCSTETILGAANASGPPNQKHTPVFPREKTWVMQPYGSQNHQNILTIDIPPTWENTKTEGSVAPNLWTRTGCRFDIANDLAQCETGGCGGRYDCSKADLGPPGGTTISEWNFYEPESSGGNNPIKYFRDSFDISAVNGVSTTMDIKDLGGSPLDPFDALPNHHTLNWLNYVGPLSKHGQDLRDDSACPPAFRLTRSQLTSKGQFGSIYGFVILGDNGQPVGGDGTVSCFSNCGKYKFPVEPLINCDISDPRCYNWKTFCAGDPSLYRQKCQTDEDCQRLAGVHAACWDQHDPKSPVDHTCQLRAFNAEPDCPPEICTFPYGAINPFTNQPDYSTQPPAGSCNDVDPVDTNALCIGDDTVHKVFPRAYTWPNDAAVYTDDAPVYKVISAPGGTEVPITPVGDIPQCSDLPKVYNYSFWREGDNPPCGEKVFPTTQFAIARPSPLPWSCDLLGGAGNDGVICRWFGAKPTATPTGSVPTPTPTPTSVAPSPTSGAPTPTPTGAVPTLTPSPTRTARPIATATPSGVITLSPAALDFGKVKVGKSSNSKIVVVSNGNGSVTLNSFKVDPDFQMDSTTCPSLPATLRPGQSCKIALSFQPLSVGAKSELFQAFNSASNSPQKVTLTGTGR